MALSGAIVDLDGTVYRGEQLLPGVGTGIDALRAAGLNLLFLSNNPTKDGAAYVDRLSGFGLDVRDGEACSAGVVMTEFLQEYHADDTIMLIGADGLRDQFERRGLTLTTEADETDVLVVSWDPTFDFEDMTDTLHAVDADTTFLGTDPDRTFPMEGDRIVPGSGAIIGSVAATVGREPDAVLGKPSEAALEIALDRLGAPAEELLIVGDRLDTDLTMGANAGMTTVLVLTGVTDREDVATSPVQPDYIIDGLGDIGDILDTL
jgi:HAD superfamily hydrolase (TIGR01450 family)